MIFGYNGRDGVVTDDNGLIYMRARYYSPEMKRFINADIVAGQLSNAITLNRFAYANGNPVSFVDPFGLSADEKWGMSKSEYEITSDVISAVGYLTDVLSPIGEKAMESAIRNYPRPNNIGKGTWAKQVESDIAYMNKGFEYAGYGITTVFTILNTGTGIEENIQNGEATGEIISDAAIDIGSGVVSVTATILLTKAGTAISPGWGTVIGLVVGLAYDFIIDPLLDGLLEF